MVYKDVLLYLLAVLHFVLVVVVVIALIMKLNVMLLVIDAMNGVTILYIIGVAAYGITSLSGDAVKGLQPFIYPFGLALSDTTSAFYYFNYTQLMLSGCIVQIVIILICFLLRIFFQ